jgi:hypothetical protein
VKERSYFKATGKYRRCDSSLSRRSGSNQDAKLINWFNASKYFFSISPIRSCIYIRCALFYPGIFSDFLPDLSNLPDD